ncbi:MAG: T9SS type A sorting domain-containing protein, partial [Flavobacteriales bacterium]
ERYCSLPGIAQGATCMAVFQDELYCAASRIIENGDTIQYLGRYTGGDYLVDCATVGVAEQGDAHSEGVTLFPNPLDERLSIRWPVDFAAEELMITDIAGRVVLRESIPPQSQSFHMNVAMLAPGTYVVHLRNRGAWQKAGRVVK